MAAKRAAKRAKVGGARRRIPSTNRRFARELDDLNKYGGLSQEKCKLLALRELEADGFNVDALQDAYESSMFVTSKPSPLDDCEKQARAAFSSMRKAINAGLKALNESGYSGTLGGAGELVLSGRPYLAFFRNERALPNLEDHRSDNGSVAQDRCKNT
jgi:hypothetical protein